MRREGGCVNTAVATCETAGEELMRAAKEDLGWCWWWLLVCHAGFAASLARLLCGG